MKENFSIDTGEFADSPLYAKQREERGWDDTELWNLDHTIASFVCPRLKRFIELGPITYPANFQSYEEWIEVLKKMLYSFERTLDENYKTFSEDYNKVQEGLELFGRYFQSIWD